MSRLPDFVDDVRRRERAARHTDSLVLTVHAAALAALTVDRALGDPGFRWWSIALPAIVYGLLWVVVRGRERATGMGGGRDGFGAAAVIALALALFFPLSFIGVTMAGVGTFLGIGLVAIGLRRKSPLLWAPGAALVALCPLVALYTIDNHVAFLGPAPGAVVLGLLTAVLAACAVRAYVVERRVLVGAPAA